MPIAIFLLVLAGIVTYGLIILYKHEGKKSDIEKLEEKMNKRFDKIDQKLGIETEDNRLKEGSKNGESKPNDKSK